MFTINKSVRIANNSIKRWIYTLKIASLDTFFLVGDTAALKLSYTSNIHIAFEKKDNNYVYIYMYFKRLKNFLCQCWVYETSSFGKSQWHTNLLLAMSSRLASSKFYNLSNSSPWSQRQYKQHILVLVGSILQPSEKNEYISLSFKRGHYKTTFITWLKKLYQLD